nr:putative ribonuclease H-like domain-containing protein [Tanacetum cinerariifolium]
VKDIKEKDKVRAKTGQNQTANGKRGKVQSQARQNQSPEEDIDYEEVFAPVARIKSIRLFLAYASFMGFMVYQMYVKSAFLYGTIKEEVYVCQPSEFEDPDYPDKVYKVVKALYRLHQAPRAWYETLPSYLLKNGFQRRKIDQTLFIKKQKDGKSACTPIDTEKPLLKDPDGEDVNVHTYRSMIGSLMYLTSSRPDIILISWQCKKQTVVATSSTKAEYVAATTASEGFEQILHFLNASSIQVEKGFSGVETPLLEGMLVPQQAADYVAIVAADDVDDVVAKDAAEPTLPSPTPPPPQELPSTSQVTPTPPPSPFAQPSSPPQQQQPSQPSHDAAISKDLLNTLLETCTTLTKKVEALEQDKDVILEEVDAAKDVEVEKNADAQGRQEESQAQVYHIDQEHADKVLSMQDDEPELAELKEVVIRDPKETATPSTIVHSEPKSKDKGKCILVKVPKPLKRQTRIEQDEAYARELEAELNININWDDVIEQVKRKGKKDNAVLRYQALKRKPQTEAQARKNIMVEELKKYLQIVPNDEDDVYTEATPLALKVPVVDYQIHTKDNKPYYKIIRPDGSHLLFLSFLSLLRNFDREDLEILWQIVRERFASSKPKNFSDNFLLTTLKAMFKNPDVEDQMILLVERRYPLTRFTLEQMLNNVRLEVEEESEMSLELLRFVRRKQQEGYRPYFGDDAIKDFKEYTLNNYYCWLKTYCCWYKIKLLDNAVDSRNRYALSFNAKSKPIRVNPWSIKGSLRHSLSQTGPNPGEQDEGQAGPNPSDAVASQPLSSPVVYAGPNLEHMDLEATNVSTQPHPEQMDEGFTATAYPKTTVETKAESMMYVTIQQDTFSIPLMTTSIIDLTSRPDSPNVHRPLQATATETTTTTTIHPPPPQPQQSTTDFMMMKRIDIPQQVSKAMDEIVNNAVDWAIQAPLRNHFRDLPKADMKEILHQRIRETKSYKTHKDHMMLYEALEKSLNRDHTEELLEDLAEARKKKKKRCDLRKSPPRSPPHQPPPPPPLAGPSGTSRFPGAFKSSQVPPPPPLPPSTNQEGQSHGSTTPSSSKTAALAEYKAWTTTDTRLRQSVSSTPKDIQIDDDMSPDAQAHSSDDEDIENAHIPKASALPSTYSPLTEDSLLAQTEQMVPDQMWIEEECKYDIAAIIEVFSMYGYDCIKKIVLRRVDLNEHIIVKRDFKYLYPSDFEDLYLLNLQGHLNQLPPKDKKFLTTAVNLWTRYLVIRQRVETSSWGLKATRLSSTSPNLNRMPRALNTSMTTR